MSEKEVKPRAVPKAKPSAYRGARALIGWLDPADARAALTHRDDETRSDAELDGEIAQARAAVQRRPAGVDLYDSVGDAPATLHGTIQVLRAHPAVGRLFDAGWDIRLVDLTRCTPLQAYVFDSAVVEEAVQQVSPDPADLASVTLSLSQRPAVPYRYDAKRRHWIFTSRDLNLRVHGEIQSPVTSGSGTFGFVVGFSESMLRIGVYKGRHVVLDGTHRGAALLRRGIRWVPALFGTLNALPTRSDTTVYLPESEVIGERPPFLTDFVSPGFHTEIRVPAWRKVITIEVKEMNVYEYD